jgi:hypothetical protein
VGVPPCAQTVQARKPVTHPQTRGLGHVSTQHGLHGCLPPLATGQRATVQCRVGGRSAHDAKTVHVVPQADGDELRHLRVASQRLDISQRDVAGRYV